MEIEANAVIQYIEPVFRFCVKRLNNRCDAEDLASEIMVHVLSGMKKYHIESLEQWVWRIAHNRYARLIAMRSKHVAPPLDIDTTAIQDDYDFVDELLNAEEYQQVFMRLHTLSSEYRDILVDYYIGQLPVKQIARKYALPETTVKWRLNVSREKIRNRIGEIAMDRVYRRINWNTTTCNGSMSSNQYLYSQLARAICEAAYEKPLTVEEISLKTGLPTMYIEDELPRLIGGDAIVQNDKKYAANFIVLRLCDKQAMKTKFAPLVADVADFFAAQFQEHEAAINELGFYGSDFTMKRLGYIALPAVLRKRIRSIKDELDIADGPYPPRLDGGYGWFIVSETETEDETAATTESGCNITDGKKDFIYYFWIGRYFRGNIYREGGTRWLHTNNLIKKSKSGIIADHALTDDDTVRLLANNLILKDANRYRWNFPVFDRTQYDSFIGFFDKDDVKLDSMLTELIRNIHSSFKAFVPKRLDSQINQWVSCYMHNIIGFVAEELICRGVLEQPDDEQPMPNGVFCVMGNYVDV